MARSIVVLLVATLVALSAFAQHEHGTIVVDYHTGQPIEAAAKAYVEVRPKGGDCPSFEGFLVEARQEKTLLVFRLPTKPASYGAVFCRNGYQSRIEPRLENVRERSRIEPFPLRLHARDECPDCDEHTRGELWRMFSELRYLYTLNKKAVAAAVQTWSAAQDVPDFGEALLKLLNRSGD